MQRCSGEKLVNGYKFVKQLGKGAFGRVELYQKADTGELIAFKKVSKATLSKKREFAQVDGRPKVCLHTC